MQFEVRSEGLPTVVIGTFTDWVTPTSPSQETEVFGPFDNAQAANSWIKDVNEQVFYKNGSRTVVWKIKKLELPFNPAFGEPNEAWKDFISVVGYAIAAANDYGILDAGSMDAVLGRYLALPGNSRSQARKYLSSRMSDAIQGLDIKKARANLALADYLKVRTPPNN